MSAPVNSGAPTTPPLRRRAGVRAVLLTCLATVLAAGLVSVPLGGVVERGLPGLERDIPAAQLPVALIVMSVAALPMILPFGLSYAICLYGAVVSLRRAGVRSRLWHMLAALCVGAAVACGYVVLRDGALFPWRILGLLGGVPFGYMVLERCLASERV